MPLLYNMTGINGYKKTEHFNTLQETNKKHIETNLWFSPFGIHSIENYLAFHATLLLITGVLPFGLISWFKLRLPS